MAHSVADHCNLISGLGGYERLAEADGQLVLTQPKEHVFMFKAAVPDSDRVRTTAQLTDGSASWSSPNSFNSRQLWEWMPVDIFVQTFGTTNDVPNLSELISSGIRLRVCWLVCAVSTAMPAVRSAWDRHV